MRSDLALWAANKFYTKLAGKVIPAKHFGFDTPTKNELSMPKGKPDLEIVSHCWQYANMLVYQLSSLVNFPPQDLTVTYTLFYAEEDKQTQKLVDVFSAIDVPNVKWNFKTLPKASLFRRGIGRNTASLQTTSDWLWFADCDLIFHKGCLDSLVPFLKTKQTGMIYPAIELVTELLPSDHPMISESLTPTPPIDVDTTLFHESQLSTPKGGSQIVHADVARAVGYCNKIKIYQEPDSRWRKTYEDTVFKNLIGYKPEPINLPHIYRIRHSDKGRYVKDSAMGNVRGKIRQVTDSQGK